MKRVVLSVFLLITSAYLQSQIILTIEGTVINDTEQDFSYGVEIQRTLPTLLTYRNNSITSVNRSGYMLLAGDEVPGIYNNNLDGAIITGNKFVWNGDEEPSTTHVLFTGYNVDITIKYNYLLNPPNGIQRKSNGMTDNNGVIAYNIVKNPLVGIVVKGMNAVKIVNNTFYSEKTNEQTTRGLIDIHKNTDGGLNATSIGTNIFNNVFYTKNNIINIKIYETACLENFESDYNLFWCESGEPLFMVGGVTKTFAQWQAMGYDKHSVVMKPDFKDFIDFIPKSSLSYGKNLGAELQSGLAIDAKWDLTTPRTVNQGETWQVGARIYATDVSDLPEPNANRTMIYPNPASGKFYVFIKDSSLINGSIEVLDIAGHLLLKKSIEVGINEIIVPGSFAPGLYNIVIRGLDIERRPLKLMIIN